MHRVQRKQKMKKKKHTDMNPVSAQDLYAGRNTEEVRDRKQVKHAARAKRRRRKKLVLLFLELLLLAVICAAVFVISKWNKRIPSDFSREEIVVNPDLSEDTLEILRGYRTIAVFGIDARDMKTEKGHSDVVMLIGINNETGEVRLCSVFRDTYSQDAIDENGTFRKLTTMYWRDGALGGLGALNRNLDLNISDYVSVNWYAVARAIDLLGGIDIEVPESMMDYINGYIQETRNATGLFTDPDNFESDYIYSAGYQHLNGVQTVAFCRIRYIDNDYGRASRQREVVNLILEKAKTAGLSTLNKAADEVLGCVETNLDAKDILSLLKVIGRFQVVDSAGFPFDKKAATVDGVSFVFPVNLEQNVKKLHQFLYGTEDYSPSRTVREISEKIIKKTGFSIN